MEDSQAAAPSPASIDIAALLAEKATLDAKFAAIPVGDLIAAASAVLARPAVLQAVADLGPIYEALPNGQAKVHVGNYLNISRAVPTLLDQASAAEAPSPSGLDAKAP